MRERLLKPKKLIALLCTAVLLLLLLPSTVMAASLTGTAAQPTLTERHIDWGVGERDPYLCIRATDVALTVAEVKSLKSDSAALMQTIIDRCNPNIVYRPSEISSSSSSSSDSSSSGGGGADVYNSAQRSGIRTALMMGAELMAVGNGPAFVAADTSTVAAVVNVETGYKVRLYTSRDTSVDYIDIQVFVTSAEPQLTIAKAPDKIAYTEGEMFSPAGMIINYTDAKGQVSDVTAACNYTPVGQLSAGTVEVVFGYEGLSVVQVITVQEATSSSSSSENPDSSTTPPESETVKLVAVRLDKLPAQLSYTEGQSFLSAGMQVTAVYSNGVEENVTKLVQLFETENLKAGTAEIKGVYAGYVITIPITVNAKATVESLRVVTLPDKMQYITGEKFDSTGLTVEATMSDGTTRMITDYVLTFDGVAAPDNHTVVVTWEDQSVSFELTVVQPTADSSSSSSESAAVPGSSSGSGTDSGFGTGPQQDKIKDTATIWLTVFLALTAVSAVAFAALIIPDIRVILWYNSKKKEAMRVSMKGSK